jgi:hypothetical protein
MTDNDARNNNGPAVIFHLHFLRLKSTYMRSKLFTAFRKLRKLISRHLPVSTRKRNVPGDARPTAKLIRLYPPAQHRRATVIRIHG